MLKNFISHEFVKTVSRGDTAIKAALKLFNKVLIPSEGGWLSYKKLPREIVEVNCIDSKIDLEDLRVKVDLVDAFLFENPGGYFASQHIEEIYEICNGKCIVIMDVSGAIGTELCDGRYADILVGSFGKWKLVDLGKGGFISCKTKEMFDKLDVSEVELEGLDEKLKKVESRAEFLLNKRHKIIEDLKEFDVLYPGDIGFVVVVAFNDDTQRESIIKYCGKNNLEWTKCPRYIRVNRRAISIEVKRL
jgi:hypothetical protein